jgi:hypothetical protein
MGRVGLDARPWTMRKWRSGLDWIQWSSLVPEYYATIGTSEFHGDAAEHLKATPELFYDGRKSAGKVTPPVALTRSSRSKYRQDTDMLYDNPTAGMAGNAPKDSALCCPQRIQQVTHGCRTSWWSLEFFKALAQLMAADLEESFICKRRMIAYQEIVLP